MPVPPNTPNLTLGRGWFDARRFHKDTDPAILDAFKMLQMIIGGSGAPGPAKSGDPVYGAVFYQPDGLGAHNLYGGNPADPVNPFPLTVSASGSATVNWEDEGVLVLSSGTANFVGSGVTVTDVAGTATITITGGGGGSTDAFGTIAVSGQSSVVADAAPDTVTFIEGFAVQITTNAGSDNVTWAVRSGDGLESDGGSPANVRVKAHTYIDVTSNGVAVDFTEVASYNGAGDQYLRNNAGTFEWATLSSAAPTAGTYIDVSGSTVNVDLTEVSGYDAGAVQLLGHDNGTFALKTMAEWMALQPGYVLGNKQSYGKDASGTAEWQTDGEC